MIVFVFVLNIPVASDAIISSSSLGGLNVNLPVMMIIQVLISYKYSFFMLEIHSISSFGDIVFAIM